MNLLNQHQHQVLVCGNPCCDKAIDTKDSRVISATINIFPVASKQYHYCSEECFVDAMETAKRSPDLTVHIKKMGEHRYIVNCETC